MTPLLKTQVMVWMTVTTAAQRLRERTAGRVHGDRGEVSSTTILIAIFCAIALAVGGILYTKFVGKANSIQTGP
jgi:hypothetical protein